MRIIAASLLVTIVFALIGAVVCAIEGGLWLVNLILRLLQQVL